MTLRAVDLSHVKAITDWDALCRFADILIFKATEGSPEGTSFLDPSFASRLAEARRRGKLIGVYHYVGSSVARKPGAARAGVVYSAPSEADWFAGHYDHRPGEVPIADYEPANPPADPDGWLAAFLQRLVGKGWPVPMTYMNTSTAASRSWANTRALGTALWVARYFANNGQVPTQQPSPGPFGSYAMWQYTSNGTVPGVTGAVDVSLFYGTPDQWHAYGSGGKPTPPPTVQEDEMRLIQQTDRGIAVVGPGYYNGVTPDGLGAATALYGAPVVFGSAADFDHAVALVTGAANLRDMYDWLRGKDPDHDNVWLIWAALYGQDPVGNDSVIVRALADVAAGMKTLQAGGVDPAEVAKLVLAGLDGAQLSVTQPVAS